MIRKLKEQGRFTEARCIHKGDLFACRFERCPPLKVGHRWHRLEWCKVHKNWTPHQWNHILSTDESRFSATSDSQHQLIFREVGTRFHYSNNTERDPYGVFWSCRLVRHFAERAD
ncbi:transposable element Tcb2 transposase [Trichonephila clavipes]|nr:transposable element Tcb2 transposase [Trichonephila clavipes]